MIEEFTTACENMYGILISNGCHCMTPTSNIPQKIYADIEKVYTYLPYIISKNDIAVLWLVGGYNLIKQLLPQAIQIEAQEDKIYQLQQQLREAQETLLDIKGVK